MTIEEVLKIYQGLIQDPEKLRTGGQKLEELLTTQPKFAVNTCKAITASDFDANFRKLIGYLVKNVLKDNWMTDKAIAGQRKEIKEVLLNGLVLNVDNFKIVEVLSLIVADLITQEGIKDWVPYLNQLIMWMNTEEIPRISAALEFLCIVFSTGVKNLHLLVPELMPILFQIFTGEVPVRLREKLLMLVYLAIDSFAWADSTQDDDIVHQCFDRTYQEWMSLFISMLQTSPKSHLNMKKIILKILTKIFSELRQYSIRSLGLIIQPVWKFMNATLPLFIWHVVYDVPLEDIEEGMTQMPEKVSKDNKGITANTHNGEDEEEIFEEGFELEEDAELTDDVEAMAVQLIELMRTILHENQIRPVLKFGLFPLINCVSHYMLFSSRMEKTWSKDPNEFVVEDRDEANIVDLRKGVISCLKNLIENFSDDEATHAIMVVSEKFLTNMQEEEVYGFFKDAFEKLSIGGDNRSSVLQDFDSEKLLALIKTSHFEAEHPHHRWKKREVGLLLMGSFAEDIITFLTKKNPEDILHWIERFIEGFYETDNPILRGRTLWCIAQYSEVLAGKGIDSLFSIYKLSATCLTQEKYLPVRVAAVKSIRTFVTKIQKVFTEELNDDEIKKEYGLNNFEVVVALFGVLEESNEQSAHLILETIYLLAKLNPEFYDRIAERFSMNIVRLFQKLQQIQQIGILLRNMIRTFSTSEKAYNHLANAFIPYILDVLTFRVSSEMPLSAHIRLEKTNEEDYLSVLFEFTRVFVKTEWSGAQANALMNVLPLIVEIMLKSKNFSILVSSSVCLKTYVTHFSDQIVKRNYVQKIVEVIYKMLDLETDETASLYIGNLIILVFANLMDKSVDAGILKQVITKLSKAKLPTIIQSLVLVYSRLINMDEKSAVNFLTSFSLNNKLGLKVLIDKWLLQQPLFRGNNTRISTFLALTKLFQLKDTRIEHLLVIGYNPSHSNNQEVSAPLKIFSLLIRGLDAEIRTRAIKEGKNIPVDDDSDQGGYLGQNDEDVRLETYQGDSEEEDDEEGYNNQLGGRIQVEFVPVQNGLDEDEIEKRFAMATREKPGKGLADLETSSAMFLSEMLEFDLDLEEADEVAEEDLIYLKDVSTELDLVELLKNFFVESAKSDPEYFNYCRRHLLKEDEKLLQNFIQINYN